MTKHDRFYIYLNEQMKSEKTLAEKIDIIEKAFLDEKITQTEFSHLQTRAFYEEKLRKLVPMPGTEGNWGEKQWRKED